jgi:3',5'-cyclic-AMP phosphodiesterase
MLKIIQVTDCHMLPPGQSIFGSDPGKRLELCIADINRNHPDAALCVLTGDLAHHADPAAYGFLRELLSELSIPYRLLPGNHDERQALLACFSDTPVDSNGFIQSVLDTAVGRLIFLDTVDPGVHTGAYCELRRAWLRAQLEQGGGAPHYLFMHHPPFPISLPHIDQYMMTGGSAFGDLVKQFPAIQHMFMGHVHRPVSGSWLGIPFSALRGTNHQSWLEFRARRENVCSLEPPAYAIAFLGPDATIVHFHDFLDGSPKFVYDPHASLDRQVRLVGGAEHYLAS